MSGLDVDITDDPAHPEGGHALIRFPGLAGPAGPGRLVIEPEGFAYDGPRQIDVEGVTTPEGLVFAVGGGKLDQLGVGVTVILALQGTGLSAEVLWPALTPLRIAAPRVRMRAGRTRTVVEEAGEPLGRPQSGAADGAGVALVARETVPRPEPPAPPRRPAEPIAEPPPMVVPQPAAVPPPVVPQPIVPPRSAPLQAAPAPAPKPQQPAPQPPKAVLPDAASAPPPPAPVQAAFTPTSAAPASAAPAAISAPRRSFGLPVVLIAAVLAFGAGAAATAVIASLARTPSRLVGEGQEQKPQQDAVKTAGTGQAPPPPQKPASPSARALYDSLFVTSDVSPLGISVAPVAPSDLVDKATNALHGPGGRPKSEQEAVFWLKRVLADPPDYTGQARPWALTRLANLMLQSGDASGQATARALLGLAADMHYAEASFDLGRLVEHGDAVAGPDLPQAKDFYKHAIADGANAAGAFESAAKKAADAAAQALDKLNSVKP